MASLESEWREVTPGLIAWNGFWCWGRVCTRRFPKLIFVRMMYVPYGSGLMSIEAL